MRESDIKPFRRAASARISEATSSAFLTKSESDPFLTIFLCVNAPSDTSVFFDETPDGTMSSFAAPKNCVVNPLLPIRLLMLPVVKLGRDDFRLALFKPARKIDPIIPRMVRAPIMAKILPPDFLILEVVS